MKVELFMRAQGIFGAEYIRPKMPATKRDGSPYREIPFSSYGLDKDGETPTKEEENS